MLSITMTKMKATQVFMIFQTMASVFGATDWKRMAMESLSESLHRKLNTNLAKNVILFIGDGMGVSTVTASRIYKGQKFGKPGEETVLEFEKFRDIALSKVYNVNAQVPDSAATATAMLCGVKTNFLIIGANENTLYNNCTSMFGNEVHSFLDYFQAEGRSTGVVSTARITHATPAATFAHTPNRNWESDANMVGVTEGCKDIAYQLVYENSDIQVVLGGGRRHFIPNTMKDPETGAIDMSNQRQDGKDLTKIWKRIQKSKGRSYNYVWNKGQFDAIDPSKTDYLFGLFNPSHMEYELERDTSAMGEPSLKEMTSKAIKILQRNKKGFFLMVESGRIDHGHHGSIAKRALEETVQMEAAVKEALRLTNQEDTLIIVTADHSHVFTIAGYPSRGHEILGINDNSLISPALDGKPYTTLLYSNGPGYALENGTRRDISGDHTISDTYRQQSAVPLYSETHSGEDVCIYAKGPMSHLIDGIQEQSYIPYVMQYAACVGEYKNNCVRPGEEGRPGIRRSTSNSMFMQSLMQTAEEMFTKDPKFGLY